LPAEFEGEGGALPLGNIAPVIAFAKDEFPQSMMLLELARQAAWVGSDFGSICAYIRTEGGDIALEYYLNLEDAENPAFMEELTALAAGGHPINRADMKPHIENNSFGCTPDLRTYGFRRSTR